MPGANGGVSALAIHDGTVYVAGGFTQMDGEARDHLAAFDATGAMTSWAPGTNGAISALMIDDGVAYIGGAFTQAGGQSRNRIAALDLATGLATTS